MKPVYSYTSHVTSPIQAFWSRPPSTLGVVKNVRVTSKISTLQHLRRAFFSSQVGGAAQKVCNADGRANRSPTPYTLHPTPYTLHPTPHILHPTPYTLHPAPFTPHPTSYTLHPSSCTLHPTPYTVHPTHYTLHPTPNTCKRRIMAEFPRL